MIEYVVQCREYTDQGWEASRIHVREDSLSALYTREQAEETVSRWNKSFANKPDDTGLPYCRVVRREVSEWEPTE